MVSHSRSRGLSTIQESELKQRVLHIAILIEANFPKETIYLSSENFDLIWNGKNFIGAGIIMQINAISESIDIRSNGVSITLSGLDPNLLMEFLTEPYQGRPVTSWIALMDEDRVIQGDPIIYFKGLLDNDSIQISGSSATINVTAESQLTNLLNANGLRYTFEDQKILYPDINDTGLKSIGALRNYEFYWGIAGLIPDP